MSESLKTCMTCWRQIPTFATRCPECLTELAGYSGIAKKDLREDRSSQDLDGRGVLLAGSFFLACYLGYAWSSNWPLGIWFAGVIIGFIVMLSEANNGKKP